MPILKGAAGHFEGDALNAFDLDGHERRWLICDGSYELPAHTEKIVHARDRLGAVALLWFAKLVPIEGNRVTCMAPDPNDRNLISGITLEKFEAVVAQPILDENGEEINLTLRKLPRKDADAEWGRGFYSEVADPSTRLTVIRLHSRNPYDCVTGLYGHSQTGEAA